MTILKLFAIAIGAVCVISFLAILLATFLAKDEANKPVQPNKTMKKIVSIIIGALLLGAVSLRAQTPTNGPAGTIFGTIQSYLTTFNPAYSWSNVTLEFDTGYAQVTGVNAASKLNGQYDIGNFDVGLSLQFSGVGSAFNAYEAQVGYAVLNHYDTKIDVILRAGYDDTKQSAVVEPGITLKKKLTENTFAETAVTMPFYFHQQFVKTPTFYIGVGFTY